MPALVVAAIVLLAGVAGIDVLAGLFSGLRLFGIRWAIADGKNLVMPLYTERALQLCFWHNAVWIFLRGFLAYRISAGSATARITAIVVEAAAIALWTPMLFIWLEGSGALVEYFGFGFERGTAAACIGFSAAAIVLLSMPATKTWCDRRRHL